MTEPETQHKPTDTAWTIDPKLTYQTFVEHERSTPMAPFLRSAIATTTDAAYVQSRPTHKERREASTRLARGLSQLLKRIGLSSQESAQ